MASRGRQILRRSLRSILVGMLLTTYTTAALGIPLSLPSDTDAAAIDDRPFPCQDGRCGCRTVEQCWKSCCCHTRTEQLRWYAERGLAAPGTIEAKVVPAKPRNCCAHSTKQAFTGQSATCQSTAAPAVSESTATATSNTRNSISLLEVQRCRGSAPLWHQVPLSLPVVLPTSVCDVGPFLGPPLMAPSPKFVSATFRPPVPPPRIEA